MAAYMGFSFTGGLPAVATTATMHHAQIRAGREQRGFPASQTLRHSPQRHHRTGAPRSMKMGTMRSLLRYDVAHCGVSASAKTASLCDRALCWLVAFR